MRCSVDMLRNSGVLRAFQLVGLIVTAMSYWFLQAFARRKDCAFKVSLLCRQAKDAQKESVNV